LGVAAGAAATEVLGVAAGAAATEVLGVAAGAAATGALGVAAGAAATGALGVAAGFEPAVEAGALAGVGPTGGLVVPGDGPAFGCRSADGTVAPRGLVEDGARWVCPPGAVPWPDGSACATTVAAAIEGDGSAAGTGGELGATAAGVVAAFEISAAAVTATCAPPGRVTTAGGAGAGVALGPGDPAGVGTIDVVEAAVSLPG